MGRYSYNTDDKSHKHIFDEYYNICLDISLYDSYEPKYITILNIQNSEYNNIDKLPPKLEELYCNGNNLETLPYLPATLKRLWCHNNILCTLPCLPDLLKSIRCYNNILYELPDLPKSIEKLDCSNNIILRKIPKLPNGLLKLKCDNCDLSTLPPIPETLYDLKCSNNPKLKSIPWLPKKIKCLHCHNCGLLYLPYLPRELQAYYHNNHHKKLSDKYMNKLSKKEPASLKIQLTIHNNPIIENWYPLMYCYDYHNMGRIECKYRRILEGYIYKYIREVKFIRPKYIDELKHWNGYMKNIYDYYHHKRKVEKIFVKKIENWYLECKYNPEYKYCRYRLKKEHKELYNEN